MEMTQDKMMETSMQNMKGNSFFGEMPEMPMSAEDQMRSLFKNQICSLEEKLEIANANFGRAVRDNSMKWMDRNNLKMECNVLDGQMAIVKQLQSNFETLFAPAVMMN